MRDDESRSKTFVRVLIVCWEKGNSREECSFFHQLLKDMVVHHGRRYVINIVHKGRDQRPKQ